MARKPAPKKPAKSPGKATAAGKGYNCIRAAVQAGDLDPLRAQAAVRLIDELERDYLQSMGPDGAAIEARIDAAKQLEIAATINRRQTLMRLQSHLSAADRLKIVEGEGRYTQEKASPAFIDSGGLEETGIVGAKQHADRIVATSHQVMNPLFDKISPGIFGRARNRMMAMNVMREVFGEATGDPAAKAMGEAWQTVAEFLRKNFNAAGGAIAKLEKWGLPQIHDQLKIRNATGLDAQGKPFASAQEAWKAFILPLLDRARMIDFQTSKPMSDARLSLILDESFSGITTKGWDTRMASDVGAGSSMMRRHQDHRVLHFKDADSWLAYQQRFGDGDVFGSMMSHIDTMAREIGAMRALGPDPQSTLRYLNSHLIKRANMAGIDDAAAKKAGKSLAILYDHYTGAMNVPFDERTARFFSGTRQLLVSAQLGKAILSAVPGDTATSNIVANFNGLSEIKLMRRHWGLLNPLNPRHRRDAARLAMINDEAAHIAGSTLRYTGELMTNKFARHLADGVMRLTGLSGWTKMGRFAYQMETMAKLADDASKTFDQLDPKVQAQMARYRIAPEDWNVIRQTKKYKGETGGFLRPDDIGDERLATKYFNLLQSETEKAIPTASLRARAFIVGETKPGSPMGEVSRSLFMYHNYGLSMVIQHGARFRNLGTYGKIKYGVAMLGTLTLAGAMSIQLKNIANGKNPEPMDTVAFWVRALAQGGGLGIYGDLLISSVTRAGGTLLETLTGPVVGLFSDAKDLTLGNIQEAIAGKDMHLGREAVRFGRNYTPSLFYTQLAINRMFWDQVQSWIDPNAAKSFAAQETAVKKNQGTSFYWHPGEMLPEAPTLNLRSAPEGPKRRKGAARQTLPSGGFSATAKPSRAGPKAKDQTSPMGLLTVPGP